MTTGAVRVVGLRELNTAFKAISKDVADELTDELKQAADPVKTEAEQLALTKIRNMPTSPRWATMRIGVSQRQGVVYMVPASRRRRSKKSSGRTNLSTLLMERAMDPALEHNKAEITQRVDTLLDQVAKRHGF